MDMTLPPAVPLPDPPRADRPAHYRLSTETWLLILKEYREGATAPFLADKWRVSEHALRRRITLHGATKREWGDSQAIAMATAREAELEEARRNSPEAVAARLFAGLPMPADDGTVEDGAEDPAALARMATLASGRAMRGRLWAEARALGALAETYQRLAAREAETEAAAAGGGGGVRGSGPDGALTIADLPLSLVLQVLEMGTEEKVALFRYPPEGRPDPDRAVRKVFWKMDGLHHRSLSRMHYRRLATESWVEALEEAMAAAGVPLPEEGHLRGWRLMSDDEVFEGAAREMEG
ncbi:hypothetical protein [Brevundimonas sp.]|uniref:hypothetical protein n=1 Tax=Brevundimonas sp. TaxID=1871086 RepID=UPI001DEBAACA|nr:hypothetical protein [Brevundimonas sp.]MBL0948962.1 hypothetical protein [Brevundimonas sp.]